MHTDCTPAFFLLFYRLLYCLILPENRLFFGIWKVVEIDIGDGVEDAVDDVEDGVDDMTRNRTEDRNVNDNHTIDGQE